MGSAPDDLETARARIAEEAARRTGTLDLTGLRLERLPDELFALAHLRELCVGAPADRWWEHGQYPDCLTPSADGLRRLAALVSLSVINTDLADLAPIAGLANLQSLNVTTTQVADLAPLAGLPNLQSLYVGYTEVANLAPLAGLANLQSLDVSDTQVADLAPIAGLAKLQSLDVSKTPVANLAPLAGLARLQSLDVRRTQVADLPPIAGLAKLQSLNVSQTQVADLAPITGLAKLQSLDVSHTQVADLAPLAGLANLQSLDVSHTQVADLAPLAGLANLQTLNVGETQVADLAPIAGLANLQYLYVSLTQVADLAPIAGLAKLQSLDLWDTRVADLAPLAGLAKLQTLSVSDTRVADLAPIAELPNLTELNASECRLRAIPERLLHGPRLRELFLHEAEVRGYPAEALSQSHDDNCLDSLRAHVADLAAGAERITDAKLFLLGNGRVGKTQLARWLRGEAFQPEWDSTHGVRITAASLHTPDGPVRLNLWDFGGQDIYHGTHALFLRSRSIVLLAWASDTENSDTSTHGGITFRNHRLPYWLTYARLRARAAPLLLVQTKCDTPADERPLPPLPPGALDAFPYRKLLQTSARTDRGRAALDEALREAVAMLHPDGPPLIGAGRLSVQRRLEAWRDADAGLPVEQRQHRLITQQAFEALCAEAGGVSSPPALLAFLHNCGVVFHQPGLFGDRIVLDQQWALDAIYAIFRRDACYTQLRRLGGRFNRALLAALVWHDMPEPEQRLLLSMMESCGICFPLHRRGDADDPEYVAPDLLPDKETIKQDLAAHWDDAASSETATLDFPLLHPALIRAVIGAIGDTAQHAALYWQGGVCAYEATTRSRVLVEATPTGDWSGRIAVSAQRGQAAALRDSMVQRVLREAERLGLEPANPPDPRATRPAMSPADPDRPALSLAFGAAPATGPRWYVSYAWGDHTPEGKRRADAVDRICADAASRRIEIIRDRDVLRFGDRLSTFMDALAEGDRIFVVLSEKYLHSPYCMYELLGIWRESRHKRDAFLDRVRVFALPDAQFSTALDRIRIASEWKRRHDELEAAICAAGPTVLGEADLKELKLMGKFYDDVSNILALIADIRRPRTLDDFAAYGFDDPK
jgi:internalin A